MPALNSALMPYIEICVAAGVFLIASGCKLLLEAFPNRQIQSFRIRTEQIHSRDTTPGQLQEPETKPQGEQQRSNTSSTSESEQNNDKSDSVDHEESSSSSNNYSKSPSAEHGSNDTNSNRTERIHSRDTTPEYTYDAKKSADQVRAFIETLQELQRTVNDEAAVDVNGSSSSSNDNSGSLLVKYDSVDLNPEELTVQVDNVIEENNKIIKELPGSSS
ncbi:MAG: hypothetical protein MHMPM18_002536 [Marteilia pararefringens]